MKVDLSLPISAEILIPHNPPFCLITRLLEFENLSGMVESIVSADNLLLNDDGTLEPLGMLEMMAQAYAAIKGYSDLSLGGQVKRGFLVDIKQFTVKCLCREGDRLIIKIETVGTIGGFAVAKAEALCEGKILASGTVKLWVPDDQES